jgi:hypothetical protein
MKSFTGPILKVFLLIIFGFAFSSSFGQTIDEFPEDSAKYIQTLEEHLHKRINEKHEALLDTFINRWSTGGFSPAKRDSIVVVSNMLLKNRGKREPHFTNMMNLFIEINKTKFDSLHFDTWMTGLRSIMKSKKGILSKYSDYLKFTLGFSKENALYLSNTRNWYSTSNNLSFTYDSTLKIIYHNTTLKCKFREDSIQIQKTSGTFYPFTKEWDGTNGKVTWERAGYEPEDVYVKLKDYALNLRKATYTADSVEFINNLYFDEPVLGQIEDKLVHVIKPSQAIYPVFKSYKKIFKINNIYENMNYTGGFTMKGAQFIGSGGENKDAIMRVFRHDKKFMTAKSNIFILSKDRAVSRKASVTIHLGNDSIYHTGLQFNYIVKNQEIELGPNESVLSQSVYYDTYHQISMDIDRLLWNTTKDSIFFTHSRNSQIGEATFTSMNYFTLNKWLELEMRDDKHPLIAIRNYYWKNDSTRRFDVKEFAKYIEKPIYQVRQRLFPLAKDGFIFFDFDEDTVTINDKLFDYISARIEKIDYDVINLNSTVEAPNHNGVLNLRNMNLTIRGVPEVHVSDSQNVIIIPRGRKIVMKKNRNFSFGGGVISGLFTFLGDDFFFDYKNFKITLNKIDSLRMKFQTEEMNMYGRAVLANVQNTIEELSGDIYIDDPNNKSGKDNYPEYPIFESKQKSFVYYDDLFNGPYKRENFYFQLDPFKMDSLDNFNPDNLEFKGNFHSADIFPPFRETLRLREDNSLGFRRSTPEGGFPLYEGKGEYYNTIDMSNKGLKGKGRLKYLTSEAVTEDILFFPDSTSIHATEFTIDQKTTGIEYPKLASRAVNIKWYPHEDEMNIEQTKKPFEMFNEGSHLSGTLKLKPTGLKGKGKMDLSKAVLNSNYFDFKSRAFEADTANFKLRTIDSTEIAFTTDTVNARIDFDYQRGRFETIKDYAIADFPKNLYKSYLNKFVWKMDDDELEIESSPMTTIADEEEVTELAELKDGNVPGAVYLSTHLEQDSLRYSSPKSTFKLKDNTINSHQVEYIHVADAKIYPHEKNLTVGETANMLPLKKAEIITDTTKKYHRIFDAEIKIKGRKNYTGEGDYHYVDKNDKKQVVHFNKIMVDNTIHTRAEGTITEPDSFTLSPHFGYKGDVFLKSLRKDLKFKGGVKMFHDCPRIPQRFASFESVIHPDSIYIPVGEKNTDVNGENIYNGPYITIDTTHIYPTFLTPRKDASDEPLLTSSGYLHYNENEGKFKIASKPKLDDPDTLGNLTSLNKKYCRYYAEGKMNLGVDYGKFKINPVGRLNQKLKENEIKVSLTLPLEFLFSDAALDTMISDIKERKNLDPINLNSRHLEKNLNELYGEEVASNYLNQQKLFGEEAEVPKEFNKPNILFSNIDFTWHTSTDSYIAKNDFGIATINGKAINKQVNGFIEIAKKTYGDKIYIYLKLDEERFYYFYYFRGMLRVYSNNEDFINVIEDTPRRKRTIKKSFFGNVIYRYILSTKQSFSRFRKHVREVEQTINEAKLEAEKRKEQKKENKNKKEEQDKKSDNEKNKNNSKQPTDKKEPGNTNQTKKKEEPESGKKNN